MLEEFGLWAALPIFIEEFRQRSGLQVDLHIATDLDEEKLDRDCEMVLFRLVQEALANIHRHAHCTLVSVDARLEDQHVRVCVADNGRGIPYKALAAPDSSAGSVGVGIRSMRDRVRQVGGRLEIQSDHRGTVIIALIPVRSSSASRAKP